MYVGRLGSGEPSTSSDGGMTMAAEVSRVLIGWPTAVGALDRARHCLQFTTLDDLEAGRAMTVASASTSQEYVA